MPERGVLLATKLHVPGPRPDFVPRPRLADRLDEGLGRGPVLVCAPAGYGKTVLPEGPGWEMCEKVLARRDVVERLSAGW